MNLKRIIGLSILIVGIVGFFTSDYIASQVLSGQAQIAAAQKKVNQANSLFSLHPLTKELGQGMTSSAQKKINEGKQEVAYYAEMAGWIKQGAVGFLIIGAVLFLISFFCKKTR